MFEKAIAITGYVPQEETEEETIEQAGIDDNLDIVTMLKNQTKKSFVYKDEESCKKDNEACKPVKVIIKMTVSVEDL